MEIVEWLIEKGRGVKPPSIFVLIKIEIIRAFFRTSCSSVYQNKNYWKRYNKLLNWINQKRREVMTSVREWVWLVEILMMSPFPIILRLCLTALPYRIWLIRLSLFKSWNFSVVILIYLFLIWVNGNAIVIFCNP